MNPELDEIILDVREQLAFLREIGVETMDADLANIPRFEAAARIAPSRSERSSAPSVVETPAPTQLPAIELPPTTQPARREGRIRISELPSLSGRSKPQATESSPQPAPRPEDLFGGTAPILPEPVETIEQIKADIGPDCTRCKLCSLGRKQVVNSVGNFNADLMFVGEAPGADEDMQGEPFVGRAGQLLTDIIEKGLRIPRKDVFIGNINRCRPPGNRAPEPDETAACKPFLMREIAVVRPRVIVVLGATAAHNLLDVKTPISKLRGNFQEYQGVKVMPTFHPAYLLRDPHKKREVWEDMKLVRDFLKS